MFSSIVYTQSKAPPCDAKFGTFAFMKMFNDYDVDVVFGPVCSSGKLCSIRVRTFIKDNTITIRLVTMHKHSTFSQN